jgi:anti-sigma factor RsiW
MTSHDMTSHDMTSHDIDALGREERRELLTAYLDGELSAEQALLVSRWLDSNAGDLREVERLRHLWDLLENYEDEPVPEDFAAGVVEAVGVQRVGIRHVDTQHVDTQLREIEEPAGRVLQMAWYRRPMATAAAVLIAIGATALLMSNRPPAMSSQGEDTASVSRLEALGVQDLESLEFLDVIADADDDTFDALVTEGLLTEGQTADSNPASNSPIGDGAGG